MKFGQLYSFYSDISKKYAFVIIILDSSSIFITNKFGVGRIVNNIDNIIYTIRENQYFKLIK